jgi:hypothetical protein
MRPRIEYSIGKRDGRHFTRKGLEQYRADLCVELRRTGKERLANAYMAHSLEWFANNGGYVIVK